MSRTTTSPDLTGPEPTRLPDALHRAVIDAHPDLAELSRTARRRGLGIRRRRQALSMIGAASVTAVVLGGVSLYAHDRPQPARAPQASTPAATLSPEPAPLSPTRFSGRATVAALDDALATLGAGTADHVAGQDPASHPGEAYAELRWHPADGSGFSVVGINVQPAFDALEIYHCTAWQSHCSITHPTRGQTLMTYEERTATVDGTGVRAVADLLRRDGVRVVASSANGLELPANHWRVTRAEPPFSAQDLVGVVTRPWFGPQMPGRFQDEGDRLPSYVDLSAESMSNPTPKP